MYVIQYRTKVLVNTDPQRRCYWGVHAKCEIVWTAWGDREVLEYADKARAARRLQFWRELNDYACQERGKGAKQWFRLRKIKPSKAHAGA